MTVDIEAVRHRSAQQKVQLPQMYGSVDFGVRPERFTVDPNVESFMRAEMVAERPRLLADQEKVATIEAFTMLGDEVSDAYVALMPEFGFRKLTQMLAQACAEGVDSVQDAPPELRALIEDMERTPAWLDMDKVREGARLERNFSAHVIPFIIRGAFVGTFMNTYAALPMSMTGALSERTAAKRVKETGAYFITSVLPSAMDRHGLGFHSAAMVRLMHSMVRFNILRRGKWDPEIYGIPIPQVDQMPAGMMPIFLLGLSVLNKGRDYFTPEEQARVECVRYRCFLLGLPEELLPDTPREIVDIMATRHATLRKAYDDKICGDLVRATMASNLEPDDSRASRRRDEYGRSLAKLFFVKSFVNGDRKRAAEMGMALTPGDYGRAAALGALIGVRLGTYHLLTKIPATQKWADARLVVKLERELKRMGYAEFVTDSSTYSSTDGTKSVQAQN